MATSCLGLPTHPSRPSLPGPDPREPRLNFVNSLTTQGWQCPDTPDLMPAGPEPGDERREFWETGSHTACQGNLAAVSTGTPRQLPFQLPSGDQHDTDAVSQLGPLRAPVPRRLVSVKGGPPGLTQSLWPHQKPEPHLHTQVHSWVDSLGSTWAQRG